MILQLSYLKLSAPRQIENDWRELWELPDIEQVN